MSGRAVAIQQDVLLVRRKCKAFLGGEMHEGLRRLKEASVLAVERRHRARVVAQHPSVGGGEPGGISVRGKARCPDGYQDRGTGSDEARDRNPASGGV